MKPRLWSRLIKLEGRRKVDAGDEEFRINIQICDRPEGAVIGFSGGPGGATIMRQPGEAFRDLAPRARAELPGPFLFEMYSADYLAQGEAVGGRSGVRLGM